MNKRLPKWARAAVIAAIAIAGLLYALRPQPISVDSALVTRGPLAQSVEAEAKTRVRNRYVVAATVSGRLARVPWTEGDRIERGSIVAVIDPLPSTSAVTQALAQLRELQEQKAGVETLRPKPEAIAQAESRLRSAQAAQRAAAERRGAALAAYEQARRDTQRAAQLERGGFLPRAQLEAAQLNEASRLRELASLENSVKSASADVDTAQAVLGEVRSKRFDPEYMVRVYDARIAAVEAQLRTLEDQQSQTVLRAPISGSVLRVLQKSEQFVSPGAPVLELGNAKDLEIVADVLSTDAVRMRTGDAMTVLRGAGDRQLRARVRRIEPAGYTKVSALGIEEQRVNVIGDFIDAPKQLGDQYRLDVQITTWSAADAVRAPLAALFRCNERWCAFIVDGNRAKKTVLQTGHQSDAYAEVLSGLAPGQRVILHPSDRITDGAQVRV